ncbi:MAG: heme o synthase [Fidelibacterota bacterium]
MHIWEGQGNRKMITTLGHIESNIPTFWEKFRAYLEVTKPGISLMVFVSVIMGFLLGSFSTNQPVNILLLLHLLIGSTFAAAGVGALNEFVEHEVDAKMKRTKARPIPSGKLTPVSVLYLGLTVSIFGILYQAFMVEIGVSLLTLLTITSYILIYTPLKKRTEWNTMIGAVPGALPPLGGWLAATGHLDWGAWIVAGILYLWQLPHFLAIAWIYRNDYQRGGFRMLPVVDPTGKRSARHLMVSSMALLLLSLVPVFISITGEIYLFGMVTMGTTLIWFSVMAAWEKTNLQARKLLLVSIVYLPAMLGLVLLDNILY